MSIKANDNNNLLALFPLVAKEWHPTKNGNITPQNVTAKSGKKFWWKCEKGHEWAATVANRTKHNSGCPYCAGKRAIVGVNDLETVNPDLAKEWHPTKNGDITPSDVMSSSKNKYWWRCQQGHEWLASLGSRKRGHGCPYCSGRNAIEGVTDLLSQRPDIAALWHPTKNGNIKPNEITVASGRQYWWLGECGHEWQTRVATMCGKKGLSICPICSSENRTSFPEQAIYYYLMHNFDDVISRYAAHKKEIDIYVPSISIGVEYDGMRYHTPDTEKKERNKDVYFFDRGIQIFRIKESVDENIKIDKYSVLYRPWNNYIRLNDAIRTLFDLISQRCNVEFKFLDIDVDRDNSKILALYLQKKKDNSFGIKYPELLKEWNADKNNGLDPMLISVGSSQKFWWRCIHGHEWRASVNERTGNKTGCPVCAGNMLVIGVNDLETVAPNISKEWNYDKNNGLMPSHITARTNKKVWWRCSLGHEWDAAVGARLRGNGCPYCSGRLAILGETDLATTHPQLVEEWLFEKNINVSPETVKAGSNINVWWRGKCGHEWEMKISDRSSGNGCPYCSGKRVLIGFNDLQHTNPELAAEWSYEDNADITSHDVTAGSSKKVWWKCHSGHKWQATISSRTRGNGCPYCNRRIAWKGESDITTTNPEVAALWDYEKNKSVDIFSCVSGSEKIVYWKCNNGHSWKKMIKKQVNRNECPICSPDNSTKVRTWREKNPKGTKAQCSNELGLSRPTVKKWW